jgi:DNA-binding NarL/FixJ family response regulator
VAAVAEVSEQIRVLVVDDDALVRAGLTMLLAGVDDIQIVGEAADGSEVELAVAEHRPDVVLTDIRRLIEHATESEGGERRRRHAREQLDLLTGREREVAVAIGHGKSNAEISRELYMSIATVKAHVSRLLEKLEFNNRVQIALLAHDAGEA